MCLQARFKSHLLPFDFPTQVIQGMCVKTLASKFSPSLVEGAEKSSKSFLHFPSIFYLWLGGAAKQVLMNCNQQGIKNRETLNIMDQEFHYTKLEFDIF